MSCNLVKPQPLKVGDTVVIVSLSSGMLGEPFCKHTLDIGKERLKKMGLKVKLSKHCLEGIDFISKNPKARAEDLKAAFLDEEVQGIICAIGGEDTYRLLPFLMEDSEFKEAVTRNPKIFTGFSDTTVNHLMLYKLGLATYYGPNFICDIAELDANMLSYTEREFYRYLGQDTNNSIVSSPVWYEERTDFSKASVDIPRVEHKENHGFELLQGSSTFSGELLGGCLESLYDIISGDRFGDESEVCNRYGIFPSEEDWKDKILFIETSEEKPTPKVFEKKLLALKQRNVFDNIKGIIVGKPQDEAYYAEYKSILKSVVDNSNLPIVYNVNFGHSYPRCVLPYGLNVTVDHEKQEIRFNEELFGFS